MDECKWKISTRQSPPLATPTAWRDFFHANDSIQARKIGVQSYSSLVSLLSFRFILFRFRAAQWSRRTTKAQRLAGRLKLCNVLLAHSHCSIQRVDSCGGDAIPVVGGRLFSNLADNPSGVIRLPFAPVKPPITIIIVRDGRLAGARADSNSSRVHTLAAERLRYNRVLGMIFSGLPSHLIVDGGVSNLIAWRVGLHFRRPPRGVAVPKSLGWEIDRR